ncbi:MAG: futalosine hydrolase [Saprospiraceae bacterium]|jgi:futalosine hydrolase|tara:strand:+ start:262 stop:960 length:699 start_codon:yes stop_codon:yes gene_type:complete
MKILIVSATTFEIAPFLKYLEKKSDKATFFDFQLDGHTIYPLVTGVGALNTAFGLARYKGLEEIDVAINVGVAGSFDPSLPNGEVIEVITDRFADLGVEESDGSFTDVYDMGLIQSDQFPYKKGWIRNTKNKYKSGLPTVIGLTVNKVHGEASSISRIKEKYAADVETMEGAGFLYACRMADVNCNQIRAISNQVEARNKDNWEIEKAIDNLNETLIKFVTQIINADSDGNK